MLTGKPEVPVGNITRYAGFFVFLKGLSCLWKLIFINMKGRIMKMRRDKLIALLVALCMIFSIFPTLIPRSYAESVMDEGVGNIQEGIDNGILQSNNVLTDGEDEEDIKGPVIEVKDLENGQEVTKKDLSFNVSVTSEVYEEKDITLKINLNGEEKEGKIGKNIVSLKEGENNIILVAVDPIGNSTEESFMVTYRIIPKDSIEEQLDKNLAYILENTPNPTFGTMGGEWSILCLARGEYNVPDGYYDIYYDNVVDEVEELMENEHNKGKLDRNKSTEHTRLILGLTAIGRDITDVGGYDITEALGDFDYVKRQGINGSIFALIALDSNNYEIKGADTQSIKEQCIDYILSREKQAGGWALGDWSVDADPDITGMAIQGLTPYYETNKEVKAAVDRAINWLSDSQIENGGYSADDWGQQVESSESIAQVIVALSGLGINPHEDERFIKEGNSLIDALMDFAVEDGGFKHVKEYGVDAMATDQGTYALIAYDRLIKGKNRLYDMTEEGNTEPEPEKPEPEEVDKGKLKEKIAEVNELKEKDYTKTTWTVFQTALNNANAVLLDENTTQAKVNQVLAALITAIEGLEKSNTDTPGGGGGGGTPPKDKDKGYVTLSIDKKTIGKGYVLEPTKVEIKKGDTVWSLSQREMDARGISYRYSFHNKYDSVYIESIDGDGEFDHGSDSGWMYNVNGWYPNYGASKYILSDGETVQWRYTTNLGEDLGEDLSKWGGSGKDSSAEKDIVIDSKDKTPTIEVPKDIEEDYTLNATKKLNSTENITIKIPDVKHKVILNLEDVRNDIPKFTVEKDKITMIIEKGSKIKSGDSKIQLITAVDKNDKKIKELIKGYIKDDEKNLQIKSAFIMGNTEDTVLFDKPITFIFKGGKDESVGFIEKDKFTPIEIYETEEEGARATRSSYKQNYAFVKDKDLIVKTNHFTTFVSYKAIETNQEVEEKVDVVETIDLQKVYKDADAISSWAYKAISEATENGFVRGSNGKFNPKKNITRAEFITIMVSVLGLDIKGSKTNNFTDINEDHWFYQHVNTAYDAGIISGYNNKFNPNASITREEMAVIIRKALGLQYIKPSTTIKDIEKVSNWARKDVETIVANRLMIGYDDEFNPKDNTTREMAVVVLMKSYNYKNNQGNKEEAQEILEAPVTKVDSKVETKSEEKSESKHRDVKNVIENTGRFMQEIITEPIVSSVGGEWTVFSLARSHMDVPEKYYNKYYTNVEKTLKEKSGKLHPIKYTEYDRVILALTSIGKGIDDVVGYNLREPLADFETLIKQGINGPIFALIALDSNNYEIPIVKGAKTQTTRDMLIEFILEREIKGGGWALGKEPKEADPDITAMAIQSLTPYYEKNNDVKAAVDRGINWLSKAQKEDGSYTSWGSKNSESISQVIVALTGLGIDPHNDSRFIKNGNSAVDALLSFADPKGGFYHVKAGDPGNGGGEPGEVDAMATDQAMYALVAYYRFINGENPLYDMTDVNK